MYKKIKFTMKKWLQVKIETAASFKHFLDMGMIYVFDFDKFLGYTALKGALQGNTTNEAHQVILGMAVLTISNTGKYRAQPLTKTILLYVVDFNLAITLFKSIFGLQLCSMCIKC